MVGLVENERKKRMRIGERKLKMEYEKGKKRIESGKEK
jgi:hypothetical protein